MGGHGGGYSKWWVDFVVGFYLGILGGGLAIQRCVTGGGIGLAVRQEWPEGELLCGRGSERLWVGWGERDSELAWRTKTWAGELMTRRGSDGT